ncbi:hypothetical protein G3479_11295 [Shewanella baltica]|uniref:hypothetical protein n=1 Tax=Shewanella baltica TaxID=62322 RepID=UPI00217EA3EC|nr:hypothetical protein [Shewanella baltica]MCS6259831.1 hypothetical protein [Shewanella baltica]
MNPNSVIYTPEDIAAWDKALNRHFCNRPHMAILFVPKNADEALIYDNFENHGIICTIGDVGIEIDANTRPGIYEAEIEYWSECSHEGECDGGVIIHSMLPYKASDSLYKQIAKEAEARVQKVYRDNEWSGIEAYHYQELCTRYGFQGNANYNDMERVAYFLGAIGRLICYQPNPDAESKNYYVAGIKLIAELTGWHDKTDDQLKQLSIEFIEQDQYEKSALTLALLSHKQGKYQGGAA